MFSSAAACLFSLCLPVLLCQATSPIAHDFDGDRHTRDVTTYQWPSLDDRENCGPGSIAPPTRVNTTKQLLDLRTEMDRQGLHAFIVLSGDAHGTDYPSKRDLRRGFISGFTGSSGWAAITHNKAAVWTDGRYFLEAEGALDCNWIFMKSGLANVPGVSQWLTEELKTVTDATVGADPFLVSNSQWNSYSLAFSRVNITFKASDPNPVDVAWGSSQPPLPRTPVNALAMKFAGKTWQNKITDLRASMIGRGAKAFIVSSLDETAWLFNLRASDIDYHPYFLSYAIVEFNRTRLYILDKDNRLVNDSTDAETELKLHTHLNTDSTGNCTTSTGMCVEVLDYDQPSFINDVTRLADEDDGKIWITPACNYAIYSAIPDTKRIQARSSMQLAKSQKNPTEVEGMQNCYTRDSAVLIEFLAILEKQVKEGKHWTEVSAAEKLKEMRLKGQYNRGLSFGAISGSGPNGAIIHYSPSELTDRNITTQDMYLLDSGGQYLDCTTDTTRTFHFGTPSEYEKECYTRVLMGSIDLAMMVWPEGRYGRELDLVARAPLWSVGLEYRHGTGHGIGAYLSVHEGPGFISLSHSALYAEEELRPYMFFSDEPGYYEDGKFGIRLETIVMVEPTNTTHKFGDSKFLAFKPIALVPFEPNLINVDLLSRRQIEWLNQYHSRTWGEMEKRLSPLAKEWTYARTRPIDLPVSGQTTASPCATQGGQIAAATTVSTPVVAMLTIVMATIVLVM